MSLFTRFAPLLACAWILPVQSAELKLPRDGWVSWQVAAVDRAPASCCWEGWRESEGKVIPCNLDSVSGGYTTRDRETTDAMKVYARFAAGKLERLRVLAANCPVEARTPIQELADVAPDDSARWLISRARRDDADSSESVGQNAMAALAMHRGAIASNALADFARNDPRVEARKWSIFWLAIVRGDEGADIVSTAMFNDREAEVRKHAAFAITQSKAARAVPDLIRLGNTDKVGDVRAQAWFWLAQSAATEAEGAIGAALRKDTDDHVREQAVFALSQLPDERATKALISVAEDQSLTREQRKRAVFWLSQSESDSAQGYLEKVLARIAPK